MALSDGFLYLRGMFVMSILNDDTGLSMFDSSPVGCSVIEVVLNEKGNPADWIYRYCNDAFAGMKGYRRDAIINHASLELFTSVNEKFLKAYYDAAYDNEKCEFYLGENNNLHATVAPAGKTGFCTIMIDTVTGRSESDTGVRKTDKTEYILNKLSPEYASLYRIELNTEKYEILRLAGYTNAKNIVGDSMHVFNTFDEYAVEYADNFIPEKDKAEFINWMSCNNMKKMLSSNDRITYHYHSVSKDGKDSYYEAAAIKSNVNSSEFNIFLGFRNIDSIMFKEKEIQDKLENALSDAKLANEIISSIAKTYQYISRIDVDADYYEEIANRDVNTKRLKKSGRVSECSASMGAQAIADEYREEYLKFTDISTLKKRMKNEQTIDMEYRMKDGNWHKLRFIEKKRNKDGNVTHVLCVARSISDTKRREQTLMHQVAEAQRDADFKARFLSNMSHDIRTPINGIIGMLDLAENYPDDADMQKQCKEKIKESSKYLVSLVDDILAMSKLESGSIKEQEIAFDLSEILNRSNTIKQIEAAEKNIEFTVDWEHSELNHMYLYGNPVYLERMLNIASANAVKFTRPGGNIKVWCREKYADSENVVYEFGCSDTGIGMSEDFVEHAFDMFSQEHQTSRTNYTGTGLGLAIARKLADRMNGTIELKSKKDVGTTVIMAIPFKIGQEDKIIAPVQYEDVSIEGKRVLVVEDNELNMEIAVFMLEKNGLKIECATDGVEAVDKYAGNKSGYYDAIFMDIMMPNLNGWDATRKIRTMQREDSEKIPIIAMSANAFAEDIINSRISGMNEHLTKPLSEEKMIKVLKECIAEL